MVTRAQKYVDLLKGFDGGVLESRTKILEILETITGQKFNNDKWQFVEWATSRAAAEYSLDLG